jgi:hypothetical protein
VLEDRVVDGDDDLFDRRPAIVHPLKPAAGAVFITQECSTQGCHSPPRRRNRPSEPNTNRKSKQLEQHIPIMRATGKAWNLESAALILNPGGLYPYISVQRFRSAIPARWRTGLHSVLAVAPDLQTSVLTASSQVAPWPLDGHGCA